MLYNGESLFCRSFAILGLVEWFVQGFVQMFSGHGFRYFWKKQLFSKLTDMSSSICSKNVENK